ncbi:hypothetical protein CHLRE_11g468374v5 [Chlamydomonas reinhardtii]|uniref:Uncharacterized protein n=1 Tax=Chlamydomonas reinhardtii TaxID=3055 RepID=A0A2K3D856_CHLRE|nr:uncharacterized protein CHLRE_11g468374v5 [Chlamydomonas reinhardtii]PNW76713.1 hypothetical protein CHLRE_11g468374v5 [Chlamydomonas reinhardtii]
MPFENLFTRLSPELICHVANCMHPNYAATAFKLTCKDVAQAVREQFTTIQLRGEPRSLRSFRSRSIMIAIAEQPWPGAAFVAHWGRPEPWCALPRWQRHRLLCLAASSHHAPSLDAALAHCGMDIQADALASAIIAGDLAACRRLHEAEGCRFDCEVVAAAAGVAGSLPACEWLAETATSALSNLLPELCYAGHVDVFEWALQQIGILYQDGDMGEDGVLLGAAAAAGRVELLQNLANRFRLNLKRQHHRPTVLSHVASGCPLEVLQQYYEPWGNRLLWTAWQKRQLLMAAAASPTPDWAAKCEWLWAQWGGAVEGLDVDISPFYEPRRQWMADVMSRPDFPQRLQLLASYGLRNMIGRSAPEAAGTIGSTAAVEFCLDQLPALLRQQAVPAAGGGPAAAAGGPVPVAEQQQVAEDAAAQQQHVASLMLIAEAAAKHGRVPVLRLLRERGYIFPPDSLECVLTSLDMSFDGLTSLRYLLLEEPGAVEQGGADEDWSSLFRNAARSVADLPLLQHLHQRYASDCETATDLAVVAQGCSVEALEWVLATEAAAGRAPEPLSCVEFLEVLYSGNWAAADWLVRHGLVAASKQEVFEQLILECCDSNLIPELRWVMRSMGGGQEVHAQDHHQMPPVEWTPDLLAALHQVSNQYRLGVWHDTPARTEWLLALVATAEEALGGVTESG